MQSLIILFVLIISVAMNFTQNLVNKYNVLDCTKAVWSKELTESQVLVITRPQFAKLHNSILRDLSNSSEEKLSKFSWNDGLYNLFRAVHNKYMGIVINTINKYNMDIENEHSFKNITYNLFLYDKESKNTTDILKQLIKELTALRSYTFWNPHSKFTVSVIQEKQIIPARTLVKLLVCEMSKHFLINTIIIISVDQNSLENVDEFQITNKERLVGIYTWFPFKNPKFSSNDEEIVLLDIWQTNKFVRGKQFFPYKLKTNLRGLTIRAITAFPQPTVVDSVEKVHSNGSDTKKIIFKGGIGMVTLNTVAEAMNFTLEYLDPTQANWGTWEGIMRLIYSRKVDLVFGGASIIIHWLRVADFTIPFHFGGIVWWVPCAQSFPRWKSIIRVFSPNLWLLGLFSIIVAGIVMRLLANKHLKTTNLEWRLYQNVANCMLNSWAVLLSIGVSEMPRTKTLRMFFIAWVTYCLAVNTVFQTFLTSYLINPGLEHQISNVEEMINSDLKFGVRDQIVEGYIKGLQDKKSLEISKKMFTIKIEDALKRVAYKRDISFAEGENLITNLRINYVDENGKHAICMIRETLTTFNIAYFFPKGSPLTEIFSKVLRRLFEANFTGVWIKSANDIKILKAVYRSRLKSKDDDEDEYCALGISHLQGAFYLLVVGYGITFMVFVSEISFHIYVPKLHDFLNK
ncbi:Ionotropic receptor 570 [Blattella germanica]|nr:Ionotropic receptor 570 [Blattella germanica]